MCRLVQFRLGSRGDGNLGTGRGERNGGCPADASSGAGYKSDSPLQGTRGCKHNSIMYRATVAARITARGAVVLRELNARSEERTGIIRWHGTRRA